MLPRCARRTQCKQGTQAGVCQADTHCQSPCLTAGHPLPTANGAQKGSLGPEGLSLLSTFALRTPKGKIHQPFRILSSMPSTASAHLERRLMDSESHLMITTMI